MVLLCAAIGYPKSNIAHVTNEQTMQLLDKNLYNGEKMERVWIGGSRLGRGRTNWVWYTYRDINRKSVTDIKNFFWGNRENEEDSEATRGREDCLLQDVGEKKWSTDTCVHHHRAICEFNCKGIVLN